MGRQSGAVWIKSSAKEWSKVVKNDFLTPYFPCFLFNDSQSEVTIKTKGSGDCPEPFVVSVNIKIK